MTWDVVVVGGGPAGSTVASILLRHRPQSRVLILEKAAFPRHHVGETLISEINLVLHEMGAYDAVASAGFVPKHGVTFQWGDRQPWTLWFHQMRAVRGMTARFGEVQTTYTWHVDRAVYDDLLLRNAARLGATVRNETAIEPVVEGDRVVGVRTEHETHRARIVVDASGQTGFAGGKATREMDPRLKNIAHWGYYQGLAFAEDLNGSPAASRAWIGAHSYGWSWVFPIRPDLASVGVVRRADEPKGPPEELLDAAIASSPAMTRLLGNARRVAYAPGMPEVLSITDFSYVSADPWRPGFVRVGDAAGFVDPILSVGCHLAQTLGRMLAYGIRSLLDEELEESAVLAAHARQTRDTLFAYRELTYYFYSLSGTKDAWWRLAAVLVEGAALPRLASDYQSFLAFATGFAARGAVWEPTAMFDVPFFVDAHRHHGGPEVEPAPGAVPPDGVPPGVVVRPAGPYSVGPTLVPLDGQGRLVPALRVEVDGDTPALVRRMHLSPALRPMLERLRDGATEAELVQAIVADVDEKHHDAARAAVRAALRALWARRMVTAGAPWRDAEAPSPDAEDPSRGGRA